MTNNYLSAEMKPAAVKAAMKSVADWQIYHPARQNPSDWTSGALYAGMSAWAEIADEEKYKEWLYCIGVHNRWRLGTGQRPYHADDHCVGQMYLEMYERQKDPKMIEDTIKRFDMILAEPSTIGLVFHPPLCLDRWSWCDALFMAPPVWARLAAVTGERKYLDFMDQEWWATTDYLYDKEEKLFFRDSGYFDKREENGQKIFWSRGNGWVVGGLARVLEVMPEDYPSRPRYVELFREMAAKIASIQQPDGLWHSSLLDPQTYKDPETSGTGFFCYGLAWGINHGLLDRETYLPVVKKAWAGLIDCVHPDGKLGWVQPPGGAPASRYKTGYDITENYGVGAFLLAGSEVYKLAEAQ